MHHITENHRLGGLNNTYLFLAVTVFGKSKIRALADSVSGENSFPSFQTVVFRPHPHVGSEQEVCVIRALFPSTKAPTSWLVHAPRDSPPNIIVLGVRTSSWILGFINSLLKLPILFPPWISTHFIIWVGVQLFSAEAERTWRAHSLISVHK